MKLVNSPTNVELNYGHVPGAVLNTVLIELNARIVRGQCWGIYETGTISYVANPETVMRAVAKGTAIVINLFELKTLVELDLVALSPVSDGVSSPK